MSARPPRTPLACPLCGAAEAKWLGVRGNREHNGADPEAIPHLVTNVMRCRSCDYIFADPPIPEAQELERRHYSDPSVYQTAPGDPQAMFTPRLEAIEAVVHPGRILDIGAGKGEFLAQARRRNWEPFGIEPSDGLRAHALKTHGLNLLGGGVESASGLDAGSFDVVTFNHVLEHIEDPLSALQGASRLLRPGGAVFIEVPNCDAHLLRLADAFFRFRGLEWSSRLSPVHPPFHSRGFTPKSISYALDAAGFEPLRVMTWPASDRGFARPAGGPSAAESLRNAASRFLAMLGNRELLAALGRKTA